MAVKHKRRSSRRRDDFHDYRAIATNLLAQSEGPQKKKWTKHDISQIQPLTDAQRTLFEAYCQGDNILAHGSAGTGKSFLALYLAMRDIVNPDMHQHKLIIVRSAVASREIGHLPGTAAEKMAVYENPYKDIMAELFGRGSTYDDMKMCGLVEFMPTSFVRGVTWDNTIVLIDEVQNLTWHEINSVVTRLGVNSRIIMTGDTVQNDLINKRSEQSGMERLMRTCNNMSEFSTVKFTTDDIVRSDFVKAWIVATEQTS